MSRPSTRLINALQTAVISAAIVALVYRATLYGMIEKPPGAAYGMGDIIDFGLGILVFFLGGACAASGLFATLQQRDADPVNAYRPAVIGMTTFVVYYLIHPYIPIIESGP